jgi:hypothetical protein
VKEIHDLLVRLGIDPTEAMCPATTVSQGETIRCRKAFDGHEAHVGRSVDRWDVVW